MFGIRTVLLRCFTLKNDMNVHYILEHVQPDCFRWHDPVAKLVVVLLAVVARVRWVFCFYLSSYRKNESWVLYQLNPPTVMKLLNFNSSGERK